MLWVLCDTHPPFPHWNLPSEWLSLCPAFKTPCRLIKARLALFFAAQNNEAGHAIDWRLGPATIHRVEKYDFHLNLLNIFCILLDDYFKPVSCYASPMGCAAITLMKQGRKGAKNVSGGGHFGTMHFDVQLCTIRESPQIYVPAFLPQVRMLKTITEGS